MAKIKLTLTRSVAGVNPKHVRTIQGLGLRRKMHQESILEDTPEVRGMINQVSYLLKVEECK